MKKRKSSSPNYPSSKRYRSPSRYHSPSRSAKRRRYDYAPNRYPSTPSPERRRRCDRYASRLSPERRRRTYDSYPSTPSPERRRRYDRHASRLSPERRSRHDSPNRYPSGRQTKRREHALACISQGTASDEEIDRYVSSNFCLPSSLSGKPVDLAKTWLGSFPGFVSDDIVIEILSRLPVESLMRFKSVWKQWWTLIEHDRRFIDLHHNNRPPNLVCISGIKPFQYLQLEDDDEQQVDDDEEKEEDIGQQQVGFRYLKFPQQILFADIVEGSSCIGEEIVPQAIFTDDKWFDYERVLGLVNGLAFFVNWPQADVRLYNVSTREASPWIKSTILSKEDKVSENGIYRFGFDPEKKEHKVFCFCSLSDGTKPSGIAECPDYTSREVLVVSRDTKFRRIKVVPNEDNQIKINKVFPSLELRENTVYANGTIYWRNEARSCKMGLDTEYSDDPNVIVALDVGSEKFRVIPIPTFILDETNMYPRYNPLFTLRGCVALRNCLSDDIVKIWMLDDGSDKKLENCQGS